MILCFVKAHQKHVAQNKYLCVLRCLLWLKSIHFLTKLIAALRNRLFLPVSFLLGVYEHPLVSPQFVHL